MTPGRGSKVRQNHPEVVVVGAGIAGLTAAALLVQRGVRVQVLERHTQPGGCASFYQRAGYRFDVGATLVSGFGSRGVHRLLFDRLGLRVPAERVEPAMVVHVAADRITRYGDERWALERRRAFGPAAESFWRAQERIADLAWDFSTRFPALPVDAGGVLALARATRPRHAALVSAIGKTIADILPAAAESKLRAFVDAQLLITSQADAASTDLVYGATALDIAREGTFHLPAGVSSIAIALARYVRNHGGEIAYATPAHGFICERGRIRGVRLADGRPIRADAVIAAIPVLDVWNMLAPPLSETLRAQLAAQPQRWGAFMAYAGLPPGAVPDDCGLHHQLVLDDAAPLGEGNSIFVSFSGPGDTQRARGGGRAVTLSTHTDVAGWERAFADGSYALRKTDYAGRLRAGLERVAPGAWDRAAVLETATPHTFARYTGRARGLVGGSPQTPRTANLRALSHRSGIAGLTLCGDSVFPGQSTVGASLSGVAAANAAR